MSTLQMLYCLTMEKGKLLTTGKLSPCFKREQDKERERERERERMERGFRARRITERAT